MPHHGSLCFWPLMAWLPPEHMIQKRPRAKLSPLQLYLRSDIPSLLHVLLVTQAILANVEETTQECECQEVGIIATVSQKKGSFHFVS